MKSKDMWDKLYYHLQAYQTAHIKIMQLKATYKNDIPSPILAQIAILKETMDAEEAEMKRIIVNKKSLT